MSAERLRVLFLSGVRHAGSYLPMLRADPRVEIVGVAEDPGAAGRALSDTRALAASAGVPFLGCPGDLAEIEADLVVVCSEPVRHARLAERALAAGRHVLVDKPFAVSLAEATSLRSAADRAPGSLSVVNLLRGPAIRRAREWVDAGHIGLPRHVDVEFLSNGAMFASNVERPELVVDPALAGGGELLNFLVYPVDYIRHLTGCEPVEVYAETATLFFEPHRRFGVEDTAVLSLLLTNGVTATVTVGRVPYAPAQTPTFFTARVLGSHGHLTVDEDRPALDRFGPGGLERWPLDGAAASEGVRLFLGTLVGDLLAGQAPGYGPADGWATVAVVDAAYRSAASGQPEPVAPGAGGR
ncbi:oxidoreductase [Streptosporangium violaceochromogenes]|nr:oxidoreductase [Streptosporangium violaceochromogenes]